jgi:hypothetical protein
MRFEERVTVLCSEALAADDDVQAGKILTELRLVLHQHIEKLRSGLRVAYTTTMIRANSVGGKPPHDAESGNTAEVLPRDAKPLRPWQQVVHEIAAETDFRKVLRLSLELTRLLQPSPTLHPGADAQTP